MASSADCLKQFTVPVLTAWCNDLGLPTGGRKAGLIERLVTFLDANLDRVPNEVRVRFPHIFVARAQTPGNDNNNPALLAQISALLDTKLAPQAEALKAMEDRIAALERNGAPGEELAFPLPTYAPEPAVAVAPKILPRALHKFVSPTVLESVLKNTFEVKDLWKLDPVRVNEIRAAEPSGSNNALDVMRSAFFPDAEDEETRIKSRYTSLTSILRPWLVYCQLRELAQPGVMVYLICHANHLLSLSDRWRNSFPAILAYHLEVAGGRMNAGDSVSNEVWLDTDLQVITNTVIPMARASAPAASIPNQPSSSTTGAPTWSKSSVGSTSSTFGCRNYNDKKPCAKWPCQFRHACLTCGVDGHPKGDQACKKR